MALILVKYIWCGSLEMPLSWDRFTSVPLGEQSHKSEEVGQRLQLMGCGCSRCCAAEGAGHSPAGEGSALSSTCSLQSVRNQRNFFILVFFKVWRTGRSCGELIQLTNSYRREKWLFLAGSALILLVLYDPYCTFLNSLLDRNLQYNLPRLSNAWTVVFSHHSLAKINCLKNKNVYRCSLLPNYLNQQLLRARILLKLMFV